jgi:chorismate mutase/prephenate dehydratase
MRFDIMPSLTDEQRRELESLRRRVSDADDAVLRSLADRAALTKQIGALRALDDGPVGFSPVNEREVLDRVDAAGAGDFPKRGLGAVFREIVSACRSLESTLRVAYDGPPGSLAHEAARKKFGASIELLACEGPRACIELVERGHADTAIFVLESSHEGLLAPSLDAIADSELKIIAEAEASGRIHVLNATGNLQDIEKVYAAPAERAACARFLATNLPRATILDTRTAEMAAQLASQDHGAAALGGDVLADLMQLVIARGNVSDSVGEQARCAVLAARPTTRSGRDVTAFLITVDDAPGALLRVLKPLADRDLNLRRIQSRPRNVTPEGRDAGRMFRFFLEVAGHVTDRPLVTAFDEMRRGVRELKIVGSYASKS